MKELYKDIPEYEGLYQVSNLGNVKSLPKFHDTIYGGYISKERILKTTNNPIHYKSVILRKDGFGERIAVHQLMAMAFLNHTRGNRKYSVDHIDNNKHNNLLSNLQVITQRENVSKDKKGGTSEYVGVCFHKQANKWVSSIRINGELNYLGLFQDEFEAHLTYQSNLSNLLNVA